jgi:branched-chain amino acid transport system substrate-binding protein
MKQDGCTKVEMANDKEVYGAGLSKNIESSAKANGLTVLANDAIDKNAANYRSLASKAKGAGADCFVYSGITANNAVQLYKDFAAALPSAKLYGPDGVAESGFVDPKEGGIPADVAKRVKVTVATLSPDQYPPEGKKFFDDFTAKYGEKNPDPYAIYGYEAASLALDAIKRANSSDRAEILKAIFATKDRSSVLGTYSIDQNGDTTLTDYGVYSVGGGNLKFDQTIKAKAG